VRIGDTVIVQRAGDVIPQIVRVDLGRRPPDAKAFEFPHTCPACGSPAVREIDPKTKEPDAVRRCTGGIACPAQVVEQIKHFASREALDIDGLGDRQIEFLFERGLVRTPADLFRLEEKDRAAETRLASFDGFGETSVTKLFNAIAARRRAPLQRLIYSLGIRHVGATNSMRLARHFASFAAFADGAATPEGRAALLEIEGVGGAAIDSLADYFASSVNVTLVGELRQMITSVAPEVVRTDSPVSGKTVVFTGSLEKMTRDEAKSTAQRLGAKVSGSVSKKTYLLVAGADAGGKLEQARLLGVQTLSEDEWLALIAGA